MSTVDTQAAGAVLPKVTGEVVIVKYNAGNVWSLTCALERLGIQPVVTDDPGRIKAADRVIFPGVGEASTAMNYLRANKMDTMLRELTQPFLGICLGLQLMCSFSEENSTECLGIFEETVKLFPKTSGKDLLKVPHMGWNTIHSLKTPLFSYTTPDSYFYFVHSYYAAAGENTIATCDYGLPFSASLHKDNYYGVQFHPEKSGEAGADILRAFLGLEQVEQVQKRKE